MLMIGCHASLAKGFAALADDTASIKADTFRFSTRNPHGGRARNPHGGRAQRIDQADDPRIEGKAATAVKAAWEGD